MVRALRAQISVLEKSILKQISPVAEFNLLKTTPGIGDILAETIWLETGDIGRFKGPGNFASYSRCVDSRRESNGKKKGENNRKNGTNSRRFRRQVSGMGIYLSGQLCDST